jgi:hypothetical protein
VSLVVISTAWHSPNEAICRASVGRQAGIHAEHVWIEASKQDPARTKLENLSDAIAPLPSDTIVALVDGDDYLSHNFALARIERAHADGAWVTYGSFAQSDGRNGFAQAYGDLEDYRRTPWRMTHLKTFRAGLFQRIDRADLFFEGEWIDRGDDPAFMWPIAEMAGRDRVTFIADCLYIYNLQTAWEKTATRVELARERAIVDVVRSRKPYARIEVL